MPKKQVWQIYHEEHEIIETLKSAIDYIKEKHGLSEQEILELAYSKDPHLKLPVEIFSTELSPLEAVVRFLKESHNLSLHEIAALLSRDDRTIWTTLSNASKKKFLVAEHSAYQIPLMLLSERRLSILEIVVEFLHEASQLSMKDIALLLKKHESTVRTAYSRAKKKRQDEN